MLKFVLDERYDSIKTVSFTPADTNKCTKYKVHASIVLTLGFEQCGCVCVCGCERARAPVCVCEWMWIKKTNKTNMNTICWIDSSTHVQTTLIGPMFNHLLRYELMDFFFVFKTLPSLTRPLNTKHFWPNDLSPTPTQPFRSTRKFLSQFHSTESKQRKTAHACPIFDGCDAEWDVKRDRERMNRAQRTRSTQRHYVRYAVILCECLFPFAFVTMKM